MAAFYLEKNIFVGTIAAINMGVDLSRSVVYAQNDNIKQEHYYLIITLLVVSVADSYMGKLLLEKN